MEVKFHGFEIGKDFNDRGGIFKKQGDTLVIDQSIPTEQPAATVEELIARKAEADAQLSFLIERIKHGQATPEETSELSSVAAQSRSLQSQLESAEEAAAQQEHARRLRAYDERRQRFDVVIAQAKQQRNKFFELYRDTCLALGAFCSSVEEATSLANSFHIPMLGTPPADSNAVRELTEKPDPLPALFESGLQGTTSFGWNFNITVIPLHKLGEKQ